MSPAGDQLPLENMVLCGIKGSGQLVVGGGKIVVGGEKRKQLFETAADFLTDRQRPYRRKELFYHCCESFCCCN